MPSNYRFDHIRIDAFQTSETYGKPKRAIGPNAFQRDNRLHGARLQADLTTAFESARDMLTPRLQDFSPPNPGVYLEIESAQGEKLPDLNWKSQGIRFGAVRDTGNDSELGALFVPLSSEDYLVTKVREYATEVTEGPQPKARHQEKMAPVEAIRAATLNSLWTDQRPIPADPEERIWWECWTWNDRSSNLIALATHLGLRAAPRALTFPEFELVPVYANRSEILVLVQNSGAVGELRRATDSPAFFTQTVRREQSLWVDDLAARITQPAEDCPAVCILDTGIARSHPLLRGTVAPTDCHTVDATWGVDDGSVHGHGTNMAGAALFGDLTRPLSDSSEVELVHGAEMVKFLPPPGFPPNSLLSYGSITQSAVAIPAIALPERRRVYCMAVTNEDVSGERPTSWSAAIDQICSGAMPGDAIDEFGEAELDPPKRLFVLSVGNIPDGNPDDVSDPDEFPVEDPAQAWNALAVGGFTDKVALVATDNLPGWQALANVGDLSPYSRISTDWNQSTTPIKPEIVFEAGNKALNPAGTELLSGVDSLSLLTTAKDFLVQPLTTFWATSAASAQAAGMCAAIMAKSPDLWPESVRALMVHSAEWTPAMKARLNACGTKKECIDLVRNFGYGVPRLERALASAQNDLALVAQAYIKPFKRERLTGADGRTKLKDPAFDEIHYYELPWPKTALESLDGDVRLKVTLSYFVEPSPGASSTVQPARYQSHGLRYELKRADQTEAAFRQHVNLLEHTGEAQPAASPDGRWTLGVKSVAAGSLHCDVWEGPAADLAARNVIAVYPVSGWWKYRAHLNRYDSRTRYCLVVSIASPESEVELYAEVAGLVGISLPTEVQI